MNFDIALGIGMSIMITFIVRINGDMKKLKADHNHLRLQFNTLASDFKEVKKDVNSLKSEFKEFRTEINTKIDFLIKNSI